MLHSRWRCRGPLLGLVQEDSYIRWFVLKENELAFDPVTQNYFALRYVPDADVDAAVAESEKLH